MEELHTDRFGRDAQIGLGVRELLLWQHRTIPGTHLACRVFRHTAQKCSAIHKVFPALFVLPDEKSDGAICAPVLCGVALSLNRTVWQQKNPRAKKETVSSFQAITRYIADHLEETLSLDALSRELFLSKYHIAHLMQKNTGLSLHQYITKKRLAACVDAMLGGEKAGESCARFGFLNYSSFYRAFIKEYGCSPSVHLQEHFSSVDAHGQERK